MLAISDFWKYVNNMFFKRIDEAKQMFDDNMGNTFLGEVLKNSHGNHSQGCC